MDMGLAKSRLKPLHSDLVDAHSVTTARWRKLNEEYPEWTLPFDGGERAQQIHAHVTLEVATRMEERHDARVNTGLDFFALSVGDEVLLRFKHLGPMGARNYPTYQQTLLAAQSYDEDMLAALGVDEPPNLLTCGYRMEPDGITLAQVVIRWDKKYHPSWEYPIFGEGAVTVEPLRLGKMPPAEPARLRSRRAEREGSKEEGGGR